MIDVDDLVEDPDFAQPMTIYRRQYMIGANYTVGVIQPEPWGAIQSGINKDLVRQSDYSSTDKFITVYTKFRFLPEGATFNVNQAPEAKAVTDIYGNQILPNGAVKYKADIVFWHGDPYEVFSIQDWTDYGAGFVSVACRKISMSETGLPQDGDYSSVQIMGALNYQYANNSSYITVTP